MLHFPVPTRPPSAFRFESPDAAEIVTAQWYSEAPALDRPDLSAAFPSESPRAEPVLLSRGERASPAKREDDERAWRNPSAEAQPEQFVGVSRHYLRTGTLKVTYLAQGRAGALSDWRALADSLKSESDA
jgi:hypothetical protein